MLKLQWPFFIDDVTIPVNGADVLQHFGLLVGLRKRSLLYPLTNNAGRVRATVCGILTNNGYCRNYSFHQKSRINQRGSIENK